MQLAYSIKALHSACWDLAQRCSPVGVHGSMACLLPRPHFLYAAARYPCDRPQLQHLLAAGALLVRGSSGLQELLTLLASACHTWRLADQPALPYHSLEAGHPLVWTQ